MPKQGGHSKYTPTQYSVRSKIVRIWRMRFVTLYALDRGNARLMNFQLTLTGTWPA